MPNTIEEALVLLIVVVVVIVVVGFLVRLLRSL